MAVLMLIVVIFYFSPVEQKIRENTELVLYQTQSSYNKACREILSLVPEWDRAQIYNIESGFKFYEVNSMLPTNKYSVNIPYFLHLDEEARHEFMAFLTTRAPAWIVSEGLDMIDIPEFKEYVLSHNLRKIPEKLYLSLGDREAKTRNSYLKTVQDNTEQIVSHYEQMGLNVTWELNPGNHFKNAALRSAKGIKAILK